MQRALNDARLGHWLAINRHLPAQLAQWLNAIFASPHNLTGLRDPELALGKHALEPLRGWDRILNADLPVPHGPLIDIGSGNGAPGLPIAMAEANRDATLLDSRQSAVRFLEQVSACHPRIRAVGDRAEQAGRGDARERYAVAVTRAAAPPAVALELGVPLLGLGGLFAAWTGPLSAEERQRLAGVAGELGATFAPVRSAPDVFVAIKSHKSPERYPRRWAQIRRAPLGSGRN